VSLSSSLSTVMPMMLRLGFQPSKARISSTGMSKPRVPERAYMYSQVLPAGSVPHSRVASALLRHIRAIVPPK
jgi:hypothetical protein